MFAAEVDAHGFVFELREGFFEEIFFLAAEGGDVGVECRFGVCVVQWWVNVSVGWITGEVAAGE